MSVQMPHIFVCAYVHMNVYLSMYICIYMAVCVCMSIWFSIYLLCTVIVLKSEYCMYH